MFALATLAPALLIAFGALFGGIWCYAALLSVSVIVAGLDTLVTRLRPAGADEEFPADRALLVAIAVATFAVLGLTTLALSTGAHATSEKIALFVATGLFAGQVGNANAHELIHKRTRALHRLGVWVYVAMLFGHHASAHLHVHHTRAATRADPNTSRLGESYYRFVARAWLGSFRDGLAAERLRIARGGCSRWQNPYVTYICGAVALCSLAFFAGGVSGLLAYIALAVFAQQQLLLCDYVQHYGLLRKTDQAGKAEPIAAQHSWNSPHWYSSAFMLNAPRHSDHHACPARGYTALRLPDDGPMLPSSLPLMACLALFPGLWRRVMDPRAAVWQTE